MIHLIVVALLIATGGWSIAGLFAHNAVVSHEHGEDNAPKHPKA